MAPTGPAYRTDWVWLNNSNVHIANHRDWFTTFTKIKSHIGSIYFGDRSIAEVHGIGDVELDVKVRDGRTGPRSHRKIILKDVLYTPSGTCNIVGNPILQDYNLSNDNPAYRYMLYDKETGAPAGIFDDAHLSRLRLVGLNATESSLRPDGIYMINAVWSDEERAKWLSRPKGDAQSQNHSLSSLSDQEKAWLKKHYGNEWKFLASYGLKLTDDEERAEGRAILRGLMEDELAMEVDPEEDDNESGSEENDFLADLEADPASHVADYQFPEKELDWVEKNYRHTGNFMRMMGLKPWDEEDCKEAVQIARSMRE
ncbi:hypothetical protein CBER1_09258 [Cercospora berteroae]|uniref:Retrovirus-related Pol polyprotein from transposon TNT 1-94-like beta-barrel domain-containing protein n=1 Tax=Cercospora berteroae TaxID=357750 RepID=A0A2S6BXU9_9PEZI|nr:hypothetical protein CBER1_09258 [Cercospora berteroae]